MKKKYYEKQNKICILYNKVLHKAWASKLNVQICMEQRKIKTKCANKPRVASVDMPFGISN